MPRSLITALALTFSAAACDSPPPAPPDAAPGDPGIRCEPDGPSPGACENDTDCPAAEDGSAEEAAKDCGLACLGSDEETCLSDCIEAGTELTAGCAGCLAVYVQCVIDHCLNECVGGDAVLCETCQAERPSVEASCQITFQACSGLELVE